MIWWSQLKRSRNRTGALMLLDRLRQGAHRVPSERIDTPRQRRLPHADSSGPFIERQCDPVVSNEAMFARVAGCCAQSTLAQLLALSATTTNANTVLPIGVLFREPVAAGACVPGFSSGPGQLRCDASDDVLSARDRFKVGRVDARAIAAQVIDFSIGRNRPHKMLVGNSMRSLRLFRASVKDAVAALISVRRPSPAAIGILRYFRQKSREIAFGHTAILSINSQVFAI